MPDVSILGNLSAKVPRWMVTAPRDFYQVLMSGPAALLDGMAEAVMQARHAFLPGQVRIGNVPGLGGYDSVLALFNIARDRLVTPAQIEGQPWVIEKPWDLAKRLRRWRDDWTNNTGAWGLLDQVAYAMVPNVPVLRLVQRGGGVTSWYTRAPDGTRTLQRSDGLGWTLTPSGTLTVDATVAQAWDWDNASLPPPPDQNDASRFWLIAYAPFSGPYLTGTDLTFNDPGVVDDAYNSPTAQVNGQPTAGVCGTNAPVGLVNLVTNIVIQRRTAGNKCPFLATAFDSTSFAPDGSSSGDLQTFLWTNVANTTISGGGSIATKTGGSAAFDAFALSSTGIFGGGAVDYTVTALPAVKINLGLAWNPTPASVNDSWYGFNVLADGTLQVQEAGSVITTIGGAGTVAPGTLLRIAVNPSGSPTRYFVNHGAGWVLAWVSALGPVFTLRAFASLWTVGDSATAALRSAAYPDGTWGWHSKPGTTGGAPTRVIARLQTAEYWRITDSVPAPSPA